MFWILAGVGATILFWVWISSGGKLTDDFIGKSIVSLGMGLIFFLLGILVSGGSSRTNSEVVFHYTEKVGTEYTSWIKDSSIAYKDSKNMFKTTTLEKVNIKKLNGELYLEYSEIRNWNDSFWKFDMEEFTEEVTVTME